MLKVINFFISIYFSNSFIDIINLFLFNSSLSQFNYQSDPCFYSNALTYIDFNIIKLMISSLTNFNVLFTYLIKSMYKYKKVIDKVKLILTTLLKDYHIICKAHSNSLVNLLNLLIKDNKLKIIIR